MTTLKLTPATAQEIFEANKAYNEKVWREKINRISSFGDPQFFILKAEDAPGYSYDRYYAVYTIEEGIRLFNQVSYSSCISNSGFCRVTIDPNGILRTFLLKDSTGKEGYAENVKANRLILAQNSKIHGAIFTNLF